MDVPFSTASHVVNISRPVNGPPAEGHARRCTSHVARDWHPWWRAGGRGALCTWLACTAAPVPLPREHARCSVYSIPCAPLIVYKRAPISISVCVLKPALFRLRLNVICLSISVFLKIYLRISWKRHSTCI
jgi:hypothetical protein